MAIVGAEIGTYTGVTTTKPCPVPGGTAQDDVLVATVWTEDPGMVVSGLSDLDWTAVHDAQTNGSPGGASQQWIAVVDGTPPATITATVASAAAGQLALATLRGRDLADLVPAGGTDTSHVASATASGPVSADTSRGSTDGVLFVQWWAATTPVTAPSGWTQLVADAAVGNYLFGLDDIAAPGVSGVQATGPGGSDAWWANLTLVQPPDSGPAEATAAVPLVVAVAPIARATHQVTAAVPLTIALAGTADAPAVADAEVTASVPLQLALTAVTAAGHAAAASVPLALTLAATTGAGIDPDRILWLPTMTTVLPDPAVQTAVPALAVETTISVAVQTDIPDPRVLTSVEG